MLAALGISRMGTFFTLLHVKGVSFGKFRGMKRHTSLFLLSGF